MFKYIFVKTNMNQLINKILQSYNKIINGIVYYFENDFFRSQKLFVISLPILGFLWNHDEKENWLYY